MAEKNYDDVSPVELAPGVFHLGVQDKRNSWANIPYLVVEGDEAALIDPGSAKPEFYSVVLQKLHRVINPKKVRYLVVQHQDPDLCAALPIFEKLAHPDVQIIAPLEASILVQHYGCSHSITPVDDGDEITIGGSRTLTFAMIPYVHFAGTMVSYDQKTKTVFSSDAFGGFTTSSDIYANEDYPELLGTFLGQYLGSKRALEYAVARIRKLQSTEGVDRICPQHGCVLPGDAVDAYLDAAGKLDVGGEVDRLAAKHSIELMWQETRLEKEGK
jgi:two-component system, cell cycle response regulator